LLVGVGHVVAPGGQSDCDSYTVRDVEVAGLVDGGLGGCRDSLRGVIAFGLVVGRLVG